MPENLTLVGTVDNQVLLIVASNEQIGRRGEDTWTYRSGRIVQVRIYMRPDRISGERIDRLEHMSGEPDTSAGASVTGGMGAIVRQVINCLSLDCVHIEQSSARVIRGRLPVRGVHNIDRAADTGILVRNRDRLAFRRQARVIIQWDKGFGHKIFARDAVESHKEAVARRLR